MTFLALLFPLIIACYLMYWHNVIIPNNNKKLFAVLSKRQNILCIENIWIDFNKLEGEIKGGSFKMLIQQHSIILLKREDSKFSYSYILVNKSFKDKTLSENFIHYGSIKKVEMKDSTLYITFRISSKSIFNEFSRQESEDTTFIIYLGADSIRTKEALHEAKIKI